MNTTVLDPATRGRAPARAPAPGRKVPDEPRNRSDAAIGGSTVPFRIATAVSLLCVPAVLALATRAEPSTLVANNLYLGAVLVLLLLTLFMPNRVLLVLRTGMAETPEALLTAPLLLIGPRWGYIAAVAFLCGVVSLRMGTKRIDVLFNIAQGALSAAAALLVYLAVLGPGTSEVTMRTALAALLAVFVQDGVSEVLTDLGVWLDGMNASLPSLSEIWWRAYATVCGGCVAIGAAALAITRPELTIVAVILMTVSVGHQTALTLESNQRWLAEALYEASEQIRSATTADEVRPILTSALDRLWRRKDWRYSATVVPESRGSIVFPLGTGSIVLPRVPRGVAGPQLQQATATLARLADETERALGFQRELELRATRDELTGLGNRQRLWDHLDARLPRTSPRVPLGVLSIDVDRFKAINDTYGHVIGDGLLRLLAQRLRSLLGAQDEAVRMSGDEFVAVRQRAGDRCELQRFAVRLADALSQPYQVEGTVLKISVSVGVARVDHPTPRPTVLAASDAALARAKSEGRGTVVLATEEIIEAARKRLRLEADLRDAIAQGEFTLHYQPIVDTEHGSVVAVEALLRWIKDGEVQMRPDEFVPYAEETGLISSIGEWVLREGCTQVREWNARHRPLNPLRLSVNVSTAHIAQPSFCDDVARLLAETDFPPELLIIEVTETFAGLDIDKSADIGAALLALGVDLWLDDFGTGYSSLEYLRALPVQVVKLDRSFITSLGSDATTREFIASLVQLCRSIDREPLAEGVERPEQRALLAELGCTLMQGYHFARPMPLHELDAYVRAASA